MLTIMLIYYLQDYRICYNHEVLLSYQLTDLLYALVSTDTWETHRPGVELGFYGLIAVQQIITLNE